MNELLPKPVLDAYAHILEPDNITYLGSGNINKTYLLSADNKKLVIQKLSVIYRLEVIEDAIAVAAYLENKNIRAPHMIKNRFGDFIFSCEGENYRAMNFINGHSFDAISSRNMADQAGKVLGEFHRALLDFSYDYRFTRMHGGEYAFHSQELREALARHAEHDYFKAVVTLAEAMLVAMQQFLNGLVLRPHHVHGDPKISNILFDSEENAICLVDFDTLRKSGWAQELGDALRSWCNKRAEDDLNASVDLEIAELSLHAYGQVMHGLISRDEVSDIVEHAKAITLCLAIRFLTDVLNESYFNYDHKRFSRAADHHIVRAEAMFRLFKDFSNKEAQLKTMALDLCCI
jgi:Ser/Thr protein kinase RdoA (MazF antagonist)